MILKNEFKLLDTHQSEMLEAIAFFAQSAIGKWISAF